MNILFTSNLSGLGGGETSILQLMKCMNNNHNVVLLCQEEGPFPEIVRKNGIKVYIDSFKRKNILKSFIHFKKIIKKENIQIVHNNEWSAAVMFGIFSNLISKKIKNFWTCHGQWYTFNKFKIYLTKKYIKKIFCVSKNVFDNLQKYKIENCIISYLGVEDKIDNKKCGSLRDELQISSNAIVIATIARYEKIKGQLKALNGLKNILEENSNVYYLLVGGCVFQKAEDELYFQKVKEFSKGIKNVFILGERHDIDNIYNSIDLLLVPSDRESLSMVTLEAIKHNVPVISTPCQGPQEILCNNNNLITETNDSMGIEKKINKFIKDKNYRNAVIKDSAQLKERVDNLFSVKRVTRLYIHQFMEEMENE